MRTLLVVAALLSLVGCAAQAPTRDETPVDPANLPGSSATNDESASDGSELTPVASATSATAASTTSSKPSTAAADAGADAAAETPDGTKTASCTSVNGEYGSVSTLSYTVDAEGTIKVTKLTIAVTNPEGRDKNDADVYVTPKAGKEAKAFNTGDILTHAEVVTVPQATSLVVTTGAILRISTNFDKQFLLDPSSSCQIQL